MMYLWRAEVGVRVNTMPHTNVWLSGQRYGTITKVGRKWLHVKMDSGRTHKFLIEGRDGFGPKVTGLSYAKLQPHYHYPKEQA